MLEHVFKCSLLSHSALSASTSMVFATSYTQKAAHPSMFSSWSIICSHSIILLMDPWTVFASLAGASCIYDKVVEKQTSHLKAVITINSQRPQGWHCSADRHKDKQRERLCRCHTVTSGGFVFPHAAQFRIELHAFCLDFYTDRKGFPKESCLIYALNMTN